MSQAGSADDLSDLFKHRILQFGILFLNQPLSHIIAQRHSYAGHFQRVSQTVMYKNTSWQWEYLRLVLQPAKRRRKYQTVVIAFELGAIIVTLCVAMFLPQSFV